MSTSFFSRINMYDQSVENILHSNQHYVIICHCLRYVYLQIHFDVYGHMQKQLVVPTSRDALCSSVVWHGPPLENVKKLSQHDMANYITTS